MVIYEESKSAVKLAGLVCPHEHQVRVAVVLYEDEYEFLSGITALQRCPHCKSTQVDLLKLNLNNRDLYSVSLRCQACEMRFDREVQAEAMAAFLYNKERDLFERKARIFTIALYDEIIGPDDFKRK